MRRPALRRRREFELVEKEFGSKGLGVGEKSSTQHMNPIIASSAVNSLSPIVNCGCSEISQKFDQFRSVYFENERLKLTTSRALRRELQRLLSTSEQATSA